MSRLEKLLARLQSKPKDFDIYELETLLALLGYKRLEQGKTSGSRIRFVCHSRKPILIHNPHPQSTLKPYQVRDVLEALKEEGLI